VFFRNSILPKILHASEDLAPVFNLTDRMRRQIDFLFAVYHRNLSQKSPIRFSQYLSQADVIQLVVSPPTSPSDRSQKRSSDHFLQKVPLPRPPNTPSEGGKRRMPPKCETFDPFSTFPSPAIRLTQTNYGLRPLSSFHFTFSSLASSLDALP